MKDIYIIANWKSNKTSKEASEWINELRGYELTFIHKEIIVCPPFTLLSDIKLLIENNSLNIKLGAQNISLFDEGAFTGEINGKQIKEFGEYVIIGHSERRKNLSETDDEVIKKIRKALENNLMPIVCISNIMQVESLKSEFKELKFVIAYEPLFAIGSGSPDTPENANNIAKQIKNKLNNVKVLYGGSVTSENVNSFTQMQDIDGVLVGKSSLNPLEFYKIIKNA